MTSRAIGWGHFKPSRWGQIELTNPDGRLPASRIPGSRSYRFFLADVVKMLADNVIVPGDVAPQDSSG